MSQILTAIQAKKARIDLELSQANVAITLNMNRSYLSQFENGKYLLRDEELEAIKEHYESIGYNFEENTETSLASDNQELDNEVTPDEYLVDGFQIPLYLDPVLVEDLLDEYHKNTKKIDELCVYDIRANHTQQPLIGETGINKDEYDKLIREALVLMARNYNIVEELRGHDSCEPFDDFDKASTTGEFIGVSFNELAE